MQTKWWFYVAVMILTLGGGWQIYKQTKTEAVIGQVHLLRDRQILSGAPIVAGPAGRIVANKWMVATEVVGNKMMVAMDTNIIFFEGHPNERVGVIENQWLPWAFIFLFIWGGIKVIFDYKKVAAILAVMLAIALVWAIWHPMLDTKAMAGIILVAYVLTGIGMFDLVMGRIKK